MSDPASLPSRPAVSVVVLTRSRIALLRRTLSSVLGQTGVEIETIVVDNGSSDGTPTTVRAEFPDARVVENGRNLGIAGRNIGFRAARAPLVLSLDDDVELLDDRAIERLVARMERSPEIGALTLKISEDPHGLEYASEHWWHPRPRETSQDCEFPTDTINEAAVMFRAEALSAAGFYFEDLFWGGEEWDLVMGLVDAGYEIHYFPLAVRHLAPRGDLAHRADPRHALLVRNRVWIAFRRLPLGAALAHCAPRLVLWLGRSIRHGYLGSYLKGLAGLALRTGEIRRSRKPISPAARRRLREVRAGAGPLRSIPSGRPEPTGTADA